MNDDQDAAQTPPAEPQGTPPSGGVGATATCCPDVSTFDGSATASRVSGFDARTNIVDQGSGKEYWASPPPGDAPDDPFTRDGAAWCSVGLGRTTELEISFEGQSGNGCITNCTYETSVAGVVQIETMNIASNNAAFRLRGLAEGETTIRVICEGEDIGWVHVVCFPVISLRVTIGAILTHRTYVPNYDAQALSRTLNFAFKQACIDITVTDIGTLDLRDVPEIRPLEEQMQVSTPIGDQFDAALGWQENVPLPDGSLFSGVYLMYLMNNFNPNHADGIPLFYYAMPNDASIFNGVVANIGVPPGYAFKAKSLPNSYAVLAHELGHILHLLHPDQADVDQIPDSLYQSIGQPIVAQEATNTEPAIRDNLYFREIDKKSVMALDPLNMMGYWPEFTEQLYIRYHQWKACRKAAEIFVRAR